MKRLASLAKSPLACLEPTFLLPSDRADLRRFMAGKRLIDPELQYAGASRQETPPSGHWRSRN